MSRDFTARPTQRDRAKAREQSFAPALTGLEPITFFAAGGFSI
jgi:hypothetical protein